MRVLFLVNGTGLGHITQTFALCELFARHSEPLEPVAVVVTNGTPAKLALLLDSYACPVLELPSLRFRMNRAGEVSPLRTGLGSLMDLNACRRSVRQLHRVIAETKPDVVINFYEALGGFYYLQYGAAVPWIALSHQLMVGHPTYLRHARWHPQRFVLQTLTRLTALGAAQRVALSFYPAESSDNLFVTAPLLRQAVLMATPQAGDYLLAYLSNGTYLDKLANYCRRHPQQMVRCFCPDRPSSQLPANLALHRPDRERYLAELIGCRGLITTSGFESVFEGAVLGKPVVVIPLKNHLEQALNAQDALRHRVAIHAVAPEAEIPDLDWRPLQPALKFRDFVLQENHRLCRFLTGLSPVRNLPQAESSAYGLSNHLDLRSAPRHARL